MDFGSGETQVVASVTSPEQISVLVPAKMLPLTYNLAITNPDGQIAVLNDALTLQVAPIPAANALTTSQIFDLVSPSIVQIVCGNGTGSGFAFESGGYILTNHHVVEGCSAVEIKLKNNIALQGSVLGTDAVNDVAVVKVNQNLPALTLGNSDESALPIGSSIFVIGHPTGLSNAVITKGLLTSRQRESGLSYDDLTTDASTEGGSSGGAWVNEKGEVIGLHKGARPDSSGAKTSIKISIPINYIKGITSLLKSGTQIPTSTPTLSSTFTPAPTPSPTTTTALTVIKNNGMSDATSANPTAVKGATGVKIASFILSAGSGEAVAVTQIVVKNSGSAGLGLGNDFQNLRLMNNATQIGTTISSLSTAAGNTYTFTPASAVTINAGQQYIVDVYADVLTSVTNIGSAYIAVVLESVTATGKSTNTDASYPSTSADINGQQIYLATGGSLTITADSDTPIAQLRSMGQTGQTLATFKLTTGAQEAINITKLVVTDAISGNTSGAAGSIVNLKLFNSLGQQVGATVASMSSDAKAAFDGLTYQIAKDKSETLTLKGDINAYPNAVSGSTHAFSIADPSTANVIASGATTGTQLTGTDIVVSSAVGTAQTVYRSELTVVNAMSNMTGGASSQQQIGKYTFTNTSAGNYAITVSNLNPNINSTLGTGTGTMTIKRDSPSGVILATKTFSNASLANVTSWDAPFTPFTIDAANGAGSVDIYILVDTASFTPAAAKTISTSFSTTGVTWTDEVSSGIANIDGAPVYGATVTY